MKFTEYKLSCLFVCLRGTGESREREEGRGGLRRAEKLGQIESGRDARVGGVGGVRAGAGHRGGLPADMSPSARCKYCIILYIVTGGSGTIINLTDVDFDPNVT